MFGLKRKEKRSINIDLRDAVRDVLDSEGRTVSCDWYTVSGARKGCTVSFSNTDQQMVTYQFTQLASTFPGYMLEIDVTASIKLSHLPPPRSRPREPEYEEHALRSFSTPVELREWLRGEGQGAISVSYSLGITRR